MNGASLAPDLSQLGRITNRLRTVIHIAQTARREPYSGLIESLKHAERPEP